MNIILVTVLLTLLGAGLVVLLVWLGIASWKSMKYNKISVQQFQDIEKRIDEENNSLWRSKEEGDTELHKRIDEVYNHIEKEVTPDIQRQFSDIYREFDLLKSSIDSRFDKLYNQINKEKEK